MRLLDDPDDAYRLIHLPTGARLTATERTNGTGGGPSYREHSVRRADVPVTPCEEELLGALPPMTSDEVLLAALSSRLWLQDPSGCWAIGGWFNPPPHRDRAVARSRGHSRRMDGKGDHWELQWTSYPFPEDLVAALTHPRAGLTGVRVVHDSEVTHLMYGTAHLTLIPRSRTHQDRSAYGYGTWH